MPAPGEDAPRGLATSDLDALRDRALRAWDAFLALVGECDLAAPSRLPGWSGRDVLIHLGSWEHDSVDALVANAREGGGGPPHRADAGNAALVAAHHDASDEDVLAAVGRARDRVARFLGSAEESEWGLAPAQAMVGPLPVLTIIHAASYELAVHTLDLAPCGAPPPPDDLLNTAVGALVDVTGALAARTGHAAAVTVQTPLGNWAGRAPVGESGWETRGFAPGPADGTRIEGSAADVLDASAGRVSIPQYLAARRLKIHDVGGLLKLAPIAAEVPGIPGGAALRMASRTLAGVGGVLGRVPRLPGRH